MYLLEVRNISCRNNNEENSSESLNIHESDEGTNFKLDMAKVINPNDLNTNEPLRLMCLDKACLLSVTLPTRIHWILKPPALNSRAMSRNSCCASCIKQSEEIDQVCLKKSVKSSEYMQINRLKNDNSSLIETVEMLTKQLLNLNTVDANIDPSSQVSKEPAPKVSKKQKKNQKKKMKAKEGIELAEKNVSPPRQEHAASTSGMEKVNDDVAATTGKNKAKEVVVIAGDSLIKNVVGASMSKTDPNHY